MTAFRARFVNLPSKQFDFGSYNCLVGISLGQIYHQYEQFKACIQLINRKKFRSHFVLLADSLQAYNLMLKNKRLSLLEARIKAKANGDNWLNEVAPLLENLEGGYVLFRWHEWLDHPEFKEKKKWVDSLYQQDKLFQKSVNLTVTSFLKHQLTVLASQDDFDIQFVFSKCLSYIKEELAVLMLWEDHPFHFIIYPKPKHLAISYIYENFIRPKHPGILKDLVVEIAASEVEDSSKKPNYFPTVYSSIANREVAM